MGLVWNRLFFSSLPECSGLEIALTPTSSIAPLSRWNTLRLPSNQLVRPLGRQM
jgi:hypothetical protein